MSILGAWDGTPLGVTLKGRVLQGAPTFIDFAEPFFGIAVWSVDHEYQVLKIFINVYLPCQVDFVAHFSKNLHFFATRERYG